MDADNPQIAIARDVDAGPHVLPVLDVFERAGKLTRLFDREVADDAVGLAHVPARPVLAVGVEAVAKVLAHKVAQSGVRVAPVAGAVLLIEERLELLQQRHLWLETAQNALARPRVPRLAQLFGAAVGERHRARAAEIAGEDADALGRFAAARALDELAAAVIGLAIGIAEVGAGERGAGAVAVALAAVWRGTGATVGGSATAVVPAAASPRLAGIADIALAAVELTATAVAHRAARDAKRGAGHRQARAFTANVGFTATATAQSLGAAAAVEDAAATIAQQATDARRAIRGDERTAFTVVVLVFAGVLVAVAGGHECAGDEDGQKAKGGEGRAKQG